MFVSAIQSQSCSQGKDNKYLNTLNQIPNQKINYEDSVFVMYTIRELCNLNWWTFEDYSKMYKIENNAVNYFISRVFYDSEKKKILIWYGDKVYNAPTLESSSDNPIKNRICPTGGDTVYNMSALIGFRNSENEVWILYPFDNQSVSCSPNQERAIKIMEQYYFDKMKYHEMVKIVQNGAKEGEFEFKSYDYNLQDPGFWEKCWLWQKDSVGANGMYPFQIESYTDVKGKNCDKCAKQFDVPKINYPEEILKLYR
jgi:hypothetical protein